MVFTFKDFKGRSIHAIDEKFGKVSDVLFDDQTWKVRYVVVDAGGWLINQDVLLSPSSFSAGLTAKNDLLMVNLTKEQIKDAPPLESNAPVSRQYESRLHAYYGWVPYWGVLDPVVYPYPDAPFNSTGPMAPTYPEWALIENERLERFDGHLRSLDEISGYRIETRDSEKFDEISNAIIDVKDWLVIDLILNRHKWFPGGKDLVCSPTFVRDIDVESRTVHLALTKQTLVDSPEFNLDTYGAAYRKSLVNHYCRKSHSNQTNRQRTSIYSDHAPPM